MRRRQDLGEVEPLGARAARRGRRPSSTARRSATAASIAAPRLVAAPGPPSRRASGSSAPEPAAAARSAPTACRAASLSTARSSSAVAAAATRARASSSMRPISATRSPSAGSGVAGRGSSLMSSCTLPPGAASSSSRLSWSRPRRWRATSKHRTVPAIATLRDSARPAIGIVTARSTARPDVGRQAVGLVAEHDRHRARQVGGVVGRGAPGQRRHGRQAAVPERGERRGRRPRPGDRQPEQRPGRRPHAPWGRRGRPNRRRTRTAPAPGRLRGAEQRAGVARVGHAHQHQRQRSGLGGDVGRRAVGEPADRGHALGGDRVDDPRQDARRERAWTAAPAAAARAASVGRGSRARRPRRRAATPASSASDRSVGPRSRTRPRRRRALRRPERRRSRCIVGWRAPIGSAIVRRSPPGRVRPRPTPGPRRGRPSRRSTRAAKAAGSVTARSARILRSTSMPAALQTGDEPAVAHAVLAAGGVDALDPQPAELALAGAAVAEGVLQRSASPARWRRGTNGSCCRSSPWRARA